MNYYSENDPKAAATLRELIRQGHISDGVVDERSIEDVVPDELAEYKQVHLFAGFGLWSLAFRWAGIADDTPAWSCSCPCQPFSAAGKGATFADERHLWPSAFHLIQHAKRPDIPIYGEQVAGARVMPWIDLVWSDLEATGHTFRAFVLASAGFGAPIIRQRTYWMARATTKRYERRRTGEESFGKTSAFWPTPKQQPQRLCDVGRLGDAQSWGRQHGPNGGRGYGERVEPTERQPLKSSIGSQNVGGVASPDNSERGSDMAGWNYGYWPEAGRDESDSDPRTGGFAEWVECPTGDGRIERGTEPSERSLASGCESGGMGESTSFGGETGISRQIERNEGNASIAFDRGDGLGGMACTDGGESSDGELQRSGQHGFFEEDSCAMRLDEPHGQRKIGPGGTELIADSGCEISRLGSPNREGSQRRGGVLECGDERALGESSVAGGMACTDGERRQQNPGSTSCNENKDGREGRDGIEPDGDNQPSSDVEVSGYGNPGPTNGFWKHADWLRCRDDKWRPVEPGTFPLAHGYPERVGLLRGFGNAISPQVAAEFIKAHLEAEREVNEER